MRALLGMDDEHTHAWSVRHHLLDQRLRRVRLFAGGDADRTFDPRPGRRRRTRLRMRRAKPGNQRPKRVRPPGAVVLQVDPQSAAEPAGLKPGDLVTELDGTPVRDAADLQLRLALPRIRGVAGIA